MEENKRQIKELIFDLADEKLYQIVISNPRNKEKIGKVKVRPVMLKGRLLFQ